MRQVGALLTMAAATGGVLGLAGCGSSGSETTSQATNALTAPTREASTTSPERAATPRASSSSRVSQAVRALRTAGKQVKHGRPFDLETDRYRGKRVWEIKVASGRKPAHEYDVSANGKKIVRRSRDHKLSDDVPKALQAKVTLARALRTAAKHGGGHPFSEAEIDRDRGKIVWTATFESSGGPEVEVIVDAKTGRVIRTVHDDD